MVVRKIAMPAAQGSAVGRQDEMLAPAMVRCSIVFTGRLARSGLWGSYCGSFLGLTWVDEHNLDVMFPEVLVARQAPASETVLTGSV